MSEPSPLPRDQAVEAAAIMLAWTLARHGYAEARVWPDRTARMYLVTAADELASGTEQCRNLQQQAEALQRQLEAADQLATALDHYHEASRAVEIDTSAANKEAFAVASYNLGAALAGYRKSKRETTTA